MINSGQNSNKSPLSLEEIKRIDQTNLPLLEKHHLRLLAHCLACFKLMSQEESKLNRLPERGDWLKWCLDNPNLKNDKEFLTLLLEQFAVAATQLNTLASKKNIAPLQLCLDDLIENYTENLTIQ